MINYRLLIDGAFIECCVPAMYYDNKQKYSLSLLIIFVFTISVDPGVMSNYVVFHLGLHCLIAKVCVTGIKLGGD